MCPVHNNMWMGTSTGTLKVFHAPTLKAKFAGKLEIGNGQSASLILDILHVEETSSVLVVNTNGEIWSFYDKIVPGGLKIQDRILLPDNNPCFHLTKVNVQGSVEVWGTMDSNRVLLLERVEWGWKKLEFESDPKDPKLRLCSFIAHAWGSVDIPFTKCELIFSTGPWMIESNVARINSIFIKSSRCTSP